LLGIEHFFVKVNIRHNTSFTFLGYTKSVGLRGGYRW